MRMGHRDILDPSDAYWPRVRRLHIYLWAKGTLAAKSIGIVTVSLLWLLTSILGMLFSWLWRGAVIAGMLSIFDRIVPGLASCAFREIVGYEVALLALSGCTKSSSPNLLLMSFLALLALIVALTFPVRRFLKKIVEIIFMTINIVALGYPLRLVAYLASLEPIAAGKWFDRSYTLGPLSTGMTEILPADYRRDLDRLWEAYRRSQSPAHERELEELLRDFEAKYFG
jgi:hypothetical protein